MTGYVQAAVACAAIISFVHLTYAADGSTYFDECASRTGTNATVVITSSAAPTLDGQLLPVGVEVAVFNGEGLCGGVGIWDGFSLIITVWGDDSQTEEKDGLADRERFEYRIWDPTSEMELNASNAEIDVTYDTSNAILPGSNGGFSDGAIFQVGSFEVTLAGGTRDLVDRVMLHTNFPNPASEKTTFEFDLPRRTVVRAEVFDLLGRRVAVIKPDGNLLPGRHAMEVDLGGMPSGTYILRLFAGDTVRTRPFKVVRN